MDTKELEANRPELDIRNFQPYSSAEDNDSVLMVKVDGTDARMSLALLRSQVGSAVKPSIIDGVWWIGNMNTGVPAEGETPMFRALSTGVEYKYEKEAEDAWRPLVGYDVLKLKFSDLTPEQKRELIPQLKDFTPAEVEELQKPAKDMIAVLTNTNKSVGDAEISRNQSEAGRNAAESNRVTKESIRQSKETERDNSEWARNRSEAERQAQEGNRSSAEKGRADAELSRQTAEAARVPAEKVRVANENIRVQAEQLRVSAEQSRVASEGGRVTAEQNRVAAEKNRITEHGQLVTAINNAKDNAIAETGKTVQATKEAVKATSLLNQTIEDAVAATELAEAAAGSVDESKQAALSAAGSANTAATISAEKTALAVTATGNANAAARAARETAEHPNYVGTDFYVYRWNSGTKAYDKTDVYVKGEGFSVKKTYVSIALMKADVNNVAIKEGAFVLVNTADVENPDNAQLYVKTKLDNGTFRYDFLVDMSGAIGFTGKTPQFVVGTVTTGTEGSAVAYSLSERPDDADGNPVYAVNISIPRGDKGKVPTISIGSISTGFPGSAASAELVPDGTTSSGEPKFKLNLTIPQGDKGEGNFIVSETGLVAGKQYLFVPNANNTANGKFVEYIAPTILEQVQPDWNATTGKGAIANKPNTFAPTAHGHAWDAISGKPTSMSASDVHPWAKAATKPGYSASEIGASPSNHNHSGVYEPVFDKKGAFNKDFGTKPGTVCRGDDARLSDSRTPTAHSHEWGTIDNKPLAFPPVAHGHSWEEISGKPMSMPASDVPSWAKADNKPSYTAQEVGAIADAPSDGKLYSRKNGQWVDASNLPVNTILQTTNMANNIFGDKWLKCDGSIVSVLDYPLLMIPCALTQPWYRASGEAGGLSAIYGNGLFVSVVNRNGCCYWSIDGKSWNAGNGMPSDKYICGVTYGNGLFVSVGSGLCFWSTDGKSWSSGNGIPSDASIYEVAYGNGIFSCVGGSGRCYWSTDGKSWNAGNGISSDASMNGVTYGNGLFVSVGSGLCYWSTDGKSWNTGNGITASLYISGLAYGNGIFSCVSGSGLCFWSTDGKSWSAGGGIIADGNNNYIDCLSYGDGLFVSVGRNNRCYYSADGKSWSGGSVIPFSSSIYCITYGKGLLVVMGNSDAFYCSYEKTDLLLPAIENSYIKALE